MEIHMWNIDTSCDVRIYAKRSHEKIIRGVFCGSLSWWNFCWISTRARIAEAGVFSFGCFTLVVAWPARAKLRIRKTKTQTYESPASRRFNFVRRRAEESARATAARKIKNKRKSAVEELARGERSVTDAWASDWTPQLSFKLFCMDLETLITKIIRSPILKYICSTKINYESRSRTNSIHCTLQNASSPRKLFIFEDLTKTASNLILWRILVWEKYPNCPKTRFNKKCNF